MIRRTVASAVSALFSAALFAAPAAAQTLRASPAFQGQARPDGFVSVAVTLAPEGPRDADITLFSPSPWALDTARVTTPATPGATRLVPHPLGPYGELSITLDGRDEQPISDLANTLSVDAETAYVLTVDVDPHEVSTLNTPSPGPGATHHVVALTLGRDAQTLGYLWPTQPWMYGGLHAVVLDARALQRAPSEARRTLRQWVESGGELLVATPSVETLRAPVFADYFGAVEAHDGTVDGPRITATPWGFSARHGLGHASFTLHDLAANHWPPDLDAERALVDFANDARRRSDASAPPGSLRLARDFAAGEGLAAWRGFDGPRAIHRVLLPVIALLAVYVIAAGVLIARNRRSPSPLRLFVRLPLASLALLGAVTTAVQLARAMPDTARVLVFYDLGEGATTAVERVFAGLTAGQARTFALAAPEGGAVLYHGTGDTRPSLRWRDARLSLTRARIGRWESGHTYSERAVTVGGVQVRAIGNAAVIENRGPWRIEEAALLRDNAVIARLDTLEPGASRTVPFTRPDDAAETTPVLHGGPLVTSVVQMQRANDRGVQLLARVTLPDEVRRRYESAGFQVQEGRAVLRVAVSPGARAQRVASARTLTDEEAAQQALAALKADDAGDGDAAIEGDGGTDR